MSPNGGSGGDGVKVRRVDKIRPDLIKLSPQRGTSGISFVTYGDDGDSLCVQLPVSIANGPIESFGNAYFDITIEGTFLNALEGIERHIIENGASRPGYSFRSSIRDRHNTCDKGIGRLRVKCDKDNASFFVQSGVEVKDQEDQQQRILMKIDEIAARSGTGITASMMACVITLKLVYYMERNKSWGISWAMVQGLVTGAVGDGNSGGVQNHNQNRDMESVDSIPGHSLFLD